MVLSHNDFQRFRELVYGHAGITFDDSKKYYFDKKISERVKEGNFSSIDTYFAQLKRDQNGEEFKQFIEDLTTNETYFFREMQQIRCFIDEIFPAAAQRKKETIGTPLSIWSAGCSTGEEPYTLALCVKEAHPTVNFRLLATDINRAVLKKAQKAVFGIRSLKDIPAELKKKYFTEENGEFALLPSIRKEVVFRQLNLVDDAEMRKIKFQDIIFCRNVLIYFDNANRKKIIGYFHQALNPGGYLFLGHSEALGKEILGDFKQVAVKNIIFYQK